MSNTNRFLSDYIYLAEASYSDFSSANTGGSNNYDQNEVKTILEDEDKNEKFAKLVTDNYEVKAHFEDHSWSGLSDETSFSGTLFRGRADSDNAGKYVIAMKGTLELGSDGLSADLGDLAVDGLAHNQIVSMYNFWQQITNAKGQSYEVASIDKKQVLTLEYIAFKGPSLTFTFSDFIKLKGLEGQGYFIDSGVINQIYFESSTEKYKDDDDSRRQLGLGIDVSEVTVVGHSLGGHLTAAFSRLFPEVTEHAYMVNGAGVGGDGGVVSDLVTTDSDHNIMSVFDTLFNRVHSGEQGSKFDSSKITNFIGDKNIDVVTNDWLDSWANLGLRQLEDLPRLFIESASIGNLLGHAGAQLSDTMAVIDLFVALDKELESIPTLKLLEMMNSIFESGEINEGNTLETIVEKLAHLLDPNNPITVIEEDRNSLYEGILKVQDLIKVGGKFIELPYTLTSIDGALIDNVLNDDDLGLAARYALFNLNPFVLQGFDYNDHNKNGELELLSEAFPNGMSDQYIEDRVLLLQGLMEGGLKNADRIVVLELADENWVFDYIGKGEDTRFFYGVERSNRHYVKFGGKDNEILEGTYKDDHLYGGAGDDTLDGGEDNDYLEGNQGVDTLIGGDGDDILLGGSGNDTLTGSNGNDTLFGGSDTDILLGGEGHDYLHGGSGLDNLKGGEGNDVLIGGTGVLIADGGEGNDIIFSGDDDDNQLLDGNLLGGTGNDIIYAGGGKDDARGGEGNDTIYAGDDQDIDFLEGNEGNDVLYASKEGIDNLDGGADSDLLIGGLESISGTLRGGAGSDRLLGGAGNEIYAFDSSELGTDSIKDSDGTGAIEIDGQAISIGEFNVDKRLWMSTDGLYEIRKLTTEDNNHSTVTINRSGDAQNSIYIEDFEQGHFGLTFEAEPEWERQNPNGGNNVAILNGGNNNAIFDTHYFPNNNFDGVKGGGGNDRLVMDYGYIHGDAGNDYISLDPRNGEGSYIDGGSGKDLIFGANGKDYILGGADSDFILSSSDQGWLISHPDNANVKYPIGWEEGDEIFSQRNEAHRTWKFDMDFFFEPKWSEETKSYAYFMSNDLGISPDMFVQFKYGVNYQGADVELRIKPNTGQTFAETFSKGESGSDYVQGGLGDDFISGSSDGDELYGNEDNDYILGLDGDDKIYGGSNNDGAARGEYGDNLFGGAGRDFIDGGTGNDKVVGGYGDDVLYGGDGDDYIEGDVQNLIGTDAPPPLTDRSKFGADLIYGGKGEDKIWGNDGDDIIHGGDDQDTISGGKGNDYLYGDGDGDAIWGNEGDDYLFGGDGIDILYGNEGDDHIFGGDFQDYLYGGVGNDKLSGDDGNDMLYGEDGDDILEGGEGSDYLFGGDGDDILFAGSGQDILEGGEGSDTYIFNLGDGINEIKETLSDIRVNNVPNFIQFNFSADQINNVSNVNGEDLLIEFGVNDSVTVKGYYLANNYSDDDYHDDHYHASIDEHDDIVSADDPYTNNIEIAQFRFNSGEVWGSEQIFQMAPPPENPFEQPEHLIDSQGNELPYFIDALIMREEVAVKGKTQITYGFLSDTTGELQGVQLYSQEQRQAVEAALSKFSDVLNVTFVEDYNSTPDFKFYLDDLTSAGNGASAGYASAQTGEVHINATNYSDEGLLQPGQYGFEVLLHEIGHAMGLAHPFEAPVLPISENNEDNTIMSYTSNGENDIELKPFDVAALQFLYGVNQSIATGDNSYGFADKYIIDAVGLDTFDASEQTNAVTIDISEGGRSHIGEKNQSILADNQSFVSYGTSIENAIGGSGDDTLIGNKLNNTLTGGIGQDTYVFNQGDGLDTIIDADKNSTIILEDIDVKHLYQYKGTLYYSTSGDGLVVNLDHIQTWVISGKTYTSAEIKASAKTMTEVVGESILAPNVDNAILTDLKNSSLTGNKKDNILIGNDFDNKIKGGQGADQMSGRKGDDFYYVDNTNDEVIERADEGNDTVRSEVDYTLSDNVENLELSGSRANNYGGDGVSRSSELLLLDGEQLSNDSEPLPIKAIGNELNNIISGNMANNILNGKAGADTLIGYEGDDSYYVDNIGDVIVEERYGNAGNDTVYSSIDYTLENGLENLVLEGNAIYAIGNYENNKIIGNDKNNTLIGNGGNNILLGGKGDDTYIFGESTYVSNVITDTEGKNNIVFNNIDESNLVLSLNESRLYYGPNQLSSINFEINDSTYWTVNGKEYSTNDLNNKYGFDVISHEDIVLGIGQKTARIIGGYTSWRDTDDITGNSLDNTLVGDNSKNILNGGDGNDILQGNGDDDSLIGGFGDDILKGGIGNDTIRGGFGADQYHFNKGDGRDVWIEDRGNDSQVFIDGKQLINLIPTSRAEREYISEDHPDYVFYFYGDGSSLYASSVSYENKDEIEVQKFDRSTNNFGISLETYSGIDDNANKFVNYTDEVGAHSYVIGGAGEDNINSGDGNDWVIAGDGNDTIMLGKGQDEVFGGLGHDKIYGGDGNDRLFGNQANNKTVNNANAQDNDYIVGGDGNDLIDGGIGDDILIAGNNKTDQSVPFNEQIQGRNKNQGDWITGNAGNDRIWGSGGKDMLNGGSGEDEIYGNDEDDIILGDAHFDWNRSQRDSISIAEAILSSGEYINNTLPNHPTLPGYYATNYAHEWGVNGLKEVRYKLGDYEENSYLFNINVYGEDFKFDPLFVENLTNTKFERVMSDSQASSSDILHGGDGNDWIAGQLDSDYLYGGNGNDRLYGDDIHVDGNVRPDDDFLYGEAGNDLLYGGAGNDYMVGGTGEDELYGGEGNDAYVFSKGDGLDLIVDSVASDNILKFNLITFDDLLYEDGTLYYSQDKKDGIKDFDGTMFASIFIENEEYSINSFLEEMSKLDLIKSDTDIVLDAESLRLGIALTGDANINATGNYKDNILIGNSGDNQLDGAAGNDVMQGGKGNDTYLVDSETDEVIELKNEGVDTVMASLSWTLSDNVESLKLVEVSDAYGATGNILNNVLTGNSLDNSLDGREGADIMQGGLGNDTYYVDNINDQVIEAADAGVDEVISSLDNYKLLNNFEILSLENASAQGVHSGSIKGSNATGNDADNIINGNNADNIINGGKGDDVLRGAGGSDTYIIMEGEGNDIVQDLEHTTGSYDYYFYQYKNIDKIISDTSIDLSKHEWVEVAELMGHKAATLSGTNDRSEMLIGNDADNTLIGSKNQDDFIDQEPNLNGGQGKAPVFSSKGWVNGNMLKGGLGDDTYIIKSASDTIEEYLDEGIDTVEVNTDDLVIDEKWALRGSYTLSDNIEILMLAGDDNFNANGNALNNILIGNSAHNRLDGMQGADIMKGGLGNDVYQIDNINDIIVELTNEGIDRIESTISIDSIASNVENLNLMGNSSLYANGNDLNNFILGNSGQNTINGGAGNDFINGNTGNDVLIGGDGVDTFIFNTKLSYTDVQYMHGLPLATKVSNVDKIVDFSLEDVLQLDHEIFDFAELGQLSADNFVSGLRARAQDNDDFILYDTRSGRLYVDTNADARGGMIHFATLDNKADLTFDQISII